MQTSDIAKLLKQMQGKMPESSRTLLAHRFLKEIGKGLRKRDPEKLDLWIQQKGPQGFLNQCDLKSVAPFVNHEISVNDSKLADFCNRWLNIEQYKDGNEWKPITPEMHSIRLTMIKELEQLSEKH